MVKQELEDGERGFNKDMSGPWSSFDGGPSQARSKDIRPPSEGTREPEDNNNMNTNSPSKVKKIVHNNNDMNSNMISSSKWGMTREDPWNEASPIKRLEHLVES